MTTVNKRRRRASTFGAARQLPSKRWQAGYWYEGSRHIAPGTFASKADADAWLAKTRTEVSQGQWINPGAAKITFGDLAKLWLEANPRKRPSTLARDESIVRSHILPVLGPRVLANVSRREVQVLVDGWATECAASTVGRQYAVLRAVFAFAEDTDRLQRTPCRAIRLPQVQLVERPELSADDLERLAGALDEDQAVMMWVGAVLGLRWAEAAGLTVAALDLLGGSLQVRCQLSRDGTLGPVKSAAGRRTLACPAWLIDDIAAVLARRRLTGAHGDAFVFASPDGAVLRYTNWRRRVWRPATVAAGMPALRFHDLRSLSATALVASGADVKTTQTRLGHSSSRLTLDLYARATARADRVAADAVGDYLRPARKHDVQRPPGAQS